MIDIDVDIFDFVIVFEYVYEIFVNMKFREVGLFRYKYVINYNSLRIYWIGIN